MAKLSAAAVSGFLDGPKGLDKARLEARPTEWAFAAAMMLSMSCVGLGIWPMWVVVIALLINRWLKNREEFLVVFTLVCTSPAFLPPSQMPIATVWIPIVMILVGLLFYRKSALVKKSLIFSAIYMGFLFVMALKSSETLRIQSITMRNYFTALYFIVPLLVFAGKDFSMKEMLRKALIYFLVICVFYVIDAWVFRGGVLVPSTMLDHYESTIHDMIIFRRNIPRKYPHGMNIIIIIAYALGRYYNLSLKQWVILILGLAVTKTMTLVAAFLVALVFCQGQFRKVAKWGVLSLAALVALYFVDAATGSKLRLASTVQQFVALDAIEDEEDLAEFGSSRMAQVIPKIQEQIDQGRLLTGFGFLHPTLSVAPQFQIHNELYTNPEMADENVANTEVTQVNTVLNIGLLGLFVQLAYFIALFIIVKDRPDSRFYLSTLIMATILGFGGAGGFNGPNGLCWIGLSLGCILTRARRDDQALQKAERQRRLDEEQANAFPHGGNFHV